VSDPTFNNFYSAVEALRSQTGRDDLAEIIRYAYAVQSKRIVELQRSLEKSEKPWYKRLVDSLPFMDP